MIVGVGIGGNLETSALIASEGRALLNGILYIERDAAHKRLVGLIEQTKKLPIDLTGQVIYYVGSALPKPPMAVGSARPTISYRMDPFILPPLQKGLKGMIGKG